MDSKKEEKRFDIDESLILKSLLELIPDSIYFKDLQSRFILINKGMAERIELKDPREAIGKTDFDFFSDEHAQQAFQDEQNIIKTGKPIINYEEKETWYNKDYKWVYTTKMPLYDKEGEIIGTFGISRDITERKKIEEKIKFLYYHDLLTGLYNRAFFEEELIRLDTSRQLPISIIMGDVDSLKFVNDTFGHYRGDMLLKNMANIFRKCFREEDIISRWGGDEFICILPKSSKKDAERIARRIKTLCKNKSSTELTLSISLGISTKQSSTENILDILKEAEDLMYKNKLSKRRIKPENHPFPHLE